MKYIFKYIYKVLLYFKYIPKIIWYILSIICQITFWIIYAIIGFFIIFGYFIWNLKFKAKPMAVVDKFLAGLIEEDSSHALFKNLKIVRIFFGAVALVFAILITGFTFWFWSTLFAIIIILFSLLILCEII